jgi:ABC-2 type transport system ATP-binding protein
LKAVVVKGLTKFYAGHQALSGIDFEVDVGTSFALIGPNGAGKTTTIRIVSGLIRPTTGEVKVLGGDPSDWSVRSRVSILPEDAGVYEKLTVFESVYYFGLLRGMSKEEAIRGTERVISALELTERRNTQGAKLSKGLKRRTLLAMCLVSSPDLLILDEPTEGLDVRSARSVRQLLKGLVARGTTVIMSSHNMAEIQDVADKMAIIDRGRIVLSGGPRELLEATRLDSLEDVFITYTTGGGE